MRTWSLSTAISSKRPHTGHWSRSVLIEEKAKAQRARSKSEELQSARCGVDSAAAPPRLRNPLSRFPLPPILQTRMTPDSNSSFLFRDIWNIPAETVVSELLQSQTRSQREASFLHLLPKELVQEVFFLSSLNEDGSAHALAYAPR